MDSCDNENPVFSNVSVDRLSYAKLMKVYSARIFGICFSMLSNRDDAEEIAQQTFLKGFSDIKQLSDIKKFGPWITQIAKHMCLDLLQKRKRNTLAMKHIAANALKEESDYDQDQCSMLQTVLAKLSEEYRLPLMLYYFDGQSTKNIAQSLEITVGTAQTRLSRARKKLRELLSTEGGAQ